MPTNEVQPQETNNTFRWKGGILIALFLLLLISFSLYRTNKTQHRTEPKITENSLQTEVISELPSIQKNQSLPNIELALLAASSKKNTINVMIASNNGVQPIDGVELVVRFDPESISDISVAPSKLFGSVIRNTVSKTTGEILLAFVREPDEIISIQEAATLATITFTANTTQDTIFSFDTGSTVVAGNQGDNILATTKDLTIPSN